MPYATLEYYNPSQESYIKERYQEPYVENLGGFSIRAAVRPPYNYYPGVRVPGVT